MKYQIHLATCAQISHGYETPWTLYPAHVIHAAIPFQTKALRKCPIWKALCVFGCHHSKTTSCQFDSILPKSFHFHWISKSKSLEKSVTGRIKLIYGQTAITFSLFIFSTNSFAIIFGAFFNSFEILKHGNHKSHWIFAGTISINQIISSKLNANPVLLKSSANCFL
jgi:hypothetical protein